MPTSGKSLVGFMSQEDGVRYLRQACHFEGDNSDARLCHEWQTANRRIGAPMGKMGVPEIKEIPGEHRQYIDELQNQPWLVKELEETLDNACFKLVEIDPLLAMQFAVDTDRASFLTSRLNGNATLDALLQTCLPKERPEEKVDFVRSNHRRSMLIVSKNLSLKIRNEGAIKTETLAGTALHVGIELMFPVPLVHVVRLNGKCYLHNGFHRAYGVRMAGATHIPAIVRDVQTSADVGIARGETFDFDTLQSANPPTVGHFTKDRAHDVRLKSLRKVLQVNWSEYMLDED